jgi:hypothetical protein
MLVSLVPLGKLAISTMAIDAQKGPRRSARTDLLRAAAEFPICVGGFTRVRRLGTTSLSMPHWSFTCVDHERRGQGALAEQSA